LKVFDDLLDRPDQHIWTVEDFLISQLRPAARQFLGSPAAIVRDDDPLYERVQL